MNGKRRGREGRQSKSQKERDLLPQDVDPIVLEADLQGAYVVDPLGEHIVDRQEVAGLLDLEVPIHPPLMSQNEADLVQ